MLFLIILRAKKMLVLALILAQNLLSFLGYKKTRFHSENGLKWAYLEQPKYFVYLIY